MLKVRGLGKRYGGAAALADVTLDVSPGQLVGVIGPSGGGKSTLLRCVAGVEPIDEGSVEVGPFRVAPDAPAPPELRRQVGLVFQHLNLWPYRTVREHLTEGPRHVLGLPRAEAAGRAAAWAERLQVADLLDRYPGTLSGGQRQRVALGRAAVMNPQFLLLDEITSHLDPVLAGEVAGVVADLRGQGIGVVVVSHQIEFVRRTADLVHFIAGGRVQASGPPDEVMRAPSTPELAAFLDAVRGGW